MSILKNKNTKFFFGCNTPAGFKGFLQELYDPTAGWQVLLIKGSPGSGKNTVMKKVLTAMRLTGEACEEIYCSSDPSSLDGVIVHGKKKAIFDATAPHVMEPHYWGACEVLLDLSAHLNTSFLKTKASEVISLTNACSQQHKNCCTELTKAAFIENNHFRHAESKTDFHKLFSQASRLASELFTAPPAEDFFKQCRFLNAITPEGPVFFKETLSVCEKVYTLYDPFGAFSSVFLSVLLSHAEKAGEPFIACYCPLAPDRLAHLIFPRLSVGFTTLNDYHRYDSLLRADFSYADFLLREITPLDQSAREFIERAVQCLKQAKAIHDELETIYASSMDFEKANQSAQQAIAFMQ